MHSMDPVLMTTQVTSSRTVNYGFFSVIDSPPYQFLYGLIRDIGFMILAVMMLVAILFAVFPKAKKEYSAASLVRVMVSSCIALIMLVTRIPLVAMQLIFYTANKLTTTLLAVGTHGILQTLINQGGLVNGMKILVIGLLMHYGLGLGFLYFFLLMGVLLIFVFGLLIQVLGQIAGLVLTLFLPLALATSNFEFGKKWTRALFEFTAVAAFAQVLSTVYLLFVLVLVTNCFSASPTNPLQLLVTLGMAVLSIIPAKHLITEFAGMIHGSGGAMMGHADYVANHPTTAKLGGMLTGKTTGGNGSTVSAGGSGGSGGRGSTVGAGVATGTVAAGLLADHRNGAPSSVTSGAGSGSSDSNGSKAPSGGSGSNGSSGGSGGSSGVATMNLHDDPPKPPHHFKLMGSLLMPSRLTPIRSRRGGIHPRQWMRPYKSQNRQSMGLLVALDPLRTKSPRHRSALSARPRCAAYSRPTTR